MPLILKESLAVFSIPDEDKKNNTVIGLLELLRGKRQFMPSIVG